ncbi:MAG: hypothetical protein M1838_003673 [Thelocarpon superellum]|nr:MAG: hypothetical protein M1838_003673 [Thelocarpon superellum]
MPAMASLLGQTYDSSEEDDGSTSTPPLTRGTAVVAAPDVTIEDPMNLRLALANPTDTSLTYNVPYADLARAEQGPANPFISAEGNVLKRKNVLTGYAEETAVSDAMFRTQHRTFQSLGYTKDPSANGGYVGDLAKAAELGGRDVVQMRATKEQHEALRRKRQRKGDAAIVDGEGAYKGPWARYELEQHYEDAAIREGGGAELASDEEEVEEYEDGTVVAPPPSQPLPSISGACKEEANNETSVFEGAAQFDYQGRTYMHVPQDLDVDLRKDAGSIKNFIPKRTIHTWASHQKAITGLRFFPSSGHLLLSSSADSKIKLWDVYHERELLRTFHGHAKSVSDIDFNASGGHFLSASYDRQMKLWDTEYGKCVGRFSTGKIPHVIRFNPSRQHGHEFLAGMSDKKIVQFDTRSGELVQEYDHHLGPVNTITFVDHANRFITTSDDKSLRAWDYGIPVPIKFIAEPYMYSMVRGASHPSGKYAAFQSGDNQIVVYSATDKFRQNRKKSFRGHNNAGYAIDVAISPDGNFIASGDSAGWVCFWDWKTCAMRSKLVASGAKEGGKRGSKGGAGGAGTGGSAVICVAWHPQETSKVVTGALDGLIKYWD